MKKIIPIVVLLLAISLLYWGSHRSDPKPDFYSGVAEATETQASFQLGGEIAALNVDEGDSVKKGQTIATLDTRDIQAELVAAEADAKSVAAQLAELEAGSRPQQIAQARAQLQQAQAELQQLQNGATAEQLAAARHQAEAAREQWRLAQNGPRGQDVKAAEAALAGARSDLETARADEHRYKALFEDGVAPQSVWEEKANRLNQAESRYKQAREQYDKLDTGTRSEERRIAQEQFLSQQARYEDLERGTRPETIQQAQARVQALQAQLSLAEEGPRSQTIDAARAKLEAAKARVEAMRVKLAKTTLTAPTDAVVLLRNFEPGETVGAGVPVFKLADIAHPWVTIFIPEPELPGIKLGTPCEITVDSTGDQAPKLQGKVRYISSAAEYTPRQIQTQAQRVLLVFRVEVDVDNPDQVLKPGMPADVKVLR